MVPATEGDGKHLIFVRPAATPKHSHLDPKNCTTNRVGMEHRAETFGMRFSAPIANGLGACKPNRCSVWAADQSLSENIGGLRSLRAFADPPPKPPNVRALSPYAYQKASSLVLA